MRHLDEVFVRERPQVQPRRAELHSADSLGSGGKGGMRGGGRVICFRPTPFRQRQQHVHGVVEGLPMHKRTQVAIWMTEAAQPHSQGWTAACLQPHPRPIPHPHFCPSKGERKQTQGAFSATLCCLPGPYLSCQARAVISLAKTEALTELTRGGTPVYTRTYILKQRQASVSVVDRA